MYDPSDISDVVLRSTQQHRPTLIVYRYFHELPQFVEMNQIKQQDYMNFLKQIVQLKYSRPTNVRFITFGSFSKGNWPLEMQECFHATPQELLAHPEANIASFHEITMADLRLSREEFGNYIEWMNKVQQWSSDCLTPEQINHAWQISGGHFYNLRASYKGIDPSDLIPDGYTHPYFKKEQHKEMAQYRDEFVYAVPDTIDYEFDFSCEKPHAIYAMLRNYIAVSELCKLVYGFSRPFVPGEIPFRWSSQHVTSCEQLCASRVMSPMYFPFDCNRYFVFTMPVMPLFFREEKDKYQFANVKQIAVRYEKFFHVSFWNLWLQEEEEPENSKTKRSNAPKSKYRRKK